MTLILVERLEAITGQLKTQPLWLVWVGFQMPPLLEPTFRRSLNTIEG